MQIGVIDNILEIFYVHLLRRYIHQSINRTYILLLYYIISE